MHVRIAARLVAASLAALSFGCAAKNASDAVVYDTIIRNGRVVDGTGNAWYYANVAVQGDRIAAIGDLYGVGARTTIDAEGRVVAPGFIDVHTHADEGVLEQPTADNFIRNGVTTIVSGNCGGSVRDVREYLDRVDAEGTAVNVATLYGHGTILRQLKENVKGELTPEQIEKGRGIMRQAMLDGAVGMSTGLIYTPGTWSSTEEIVEFQKVAGAHRGIYATHMRSEGQEILSAIDEALRIGREAESRVQISHFKMPADAAKTMGGSDVSLGRVYRARAEGQEVWIDQYPYTASSTGMTSLFPDWVRENGDEKAREALEDPATLRRFLDDMEENQYRKRMREDMSFAVIASCRPYPELNGYNLKEAAQIFKLKAERGAEVDWKAIPESEWPAVTREEQYLALVDIYRKGGASGVFHTMPEDQVRNIMRSPLVAVASDSGIRKFGEGHPHPRGYGSNARVLGVYVREEKVIGLEDAVRKMTSLPAQAFRFDDRGLLRPGYKADIVVFDPETVRENSTFDAPHAYSTGFDVVMVNGTTVVWKDMVTGELPGKAIRGPGYDPAAARPETQVAEAK